MSLSTEHLSLPPLVKGTLNGHLTVKVDDLIWCRQPPGDVYVECRWWGMSNPVVFRPLDVTHREKSQWSLSSLLIKDYTVTFDVRTSLTMLENYLNNCENLEFIVIKSKCYEKIGTVTVTDLKNLVKERMYQSYFPIINSFGNRIGDLHIGFSLWMKSRTDEEKENKLSANGLFVNPILEENKKKGETLKICKKHSRMLKNAQNKMESQLFLKSSSMDESKKKKPPKAIESCELILKDKTHPVAHPNSIKSNMDLDSILSKGEKLRNAMFSSLYEDEVFRKTMPLEATKSTSCCHSSFPHHPSSAVATHGNNKAVLMDYLTGADVSSGEKQVAMETLKSVSPAESILFDSLSVDEIQPQLEKVEEKLQEDAVATNDADKQTSSAKESCKLDCKEKSVITSARSSREESQSESQDRSRENHNVASEESRLLEAAFRSVNCCRITVDYLKLVSTNVCKNDSKESFTRVRNIGDKKKQCQQPGAVYFVEYNFSDIKQPLNEQYYTPVRYSTKKQSGQVVQFGQKHIHNLRKPFSVERLKVSLQKANWKILRRYLNQRVPSLIGNVFIEDDLDVRLESNLRLPVKSSTGILVGELFIQLELGKDRGIFGNFLLGEKILAFPGNFMNKACVEIQTESSDLAEPSMSRDSLNNWTSSTTGNSRTNVGYHLPKQSAGKCHQIIIELDELTNYSTLLKSGKDEACYIDYKFPELDEKTNKIHFSNKFFTTDCVNCSPEIHFFFRHSHVLSASSLSQALLSAAIPGITFSLWTRKFHPGIHDLLVATAFLPTAKLCSMENEFENRNSLLQESLTLPLTSTSAIQHKGELHSKSRCCLNLTLTYRQIIVSSQGQKTTSINSSVGPTSSNTEVTASNSTERHFNELENYVERDDQTIFERTSAKESHFSSSEKVISQLKQIESHKYCEKDSCVCRNYHSLFRGEKSCLSKCPETDDQSNSLLNKRSIKNNDDFRKIDAEKRLALDTVNNPAISSILNSQLSEECQKKFVNFILHGNTKLRVASRCDGIMTNSNESTDLKSKIKSILSQCSLENMNKNCTTVQHVHVLQSGNLKGNDVMCQLSPGQDFNNAEIIPDINYLPAEQSRPLETVSKLVNDVEYIYPQLINATPVPEISNTVTESNVLVDNCNRNEHDKYSLDHFKLISPPAGFENSPSSSIEAQEQNSDSFERLHSHPPQSLLECNENGLIPSVISSFQKTGFRSQENVLRDENFFFKPLCSDKRVMSSASDICNKKEKRPDSNNYGLMQSSRKQKEKSSSESDEKRNVSRSSRATQELQEQRSYLESQTSNYVLESRTTCRTESLYELELQSGGEDGEDLLSVVTRSVENVQLDPNRSEDNHQEHDVDDLLAETRQRKSLDNHSMESTWVDSVKVSSELRNVLKHLNPSKRNDDEVYDKLLCELKAYVDNVAVEIKSQLDLIESNLHDSQQNTGNPRSLDLLSREIEEFNEREDSSSANAYSLGSQKDVQACNIERTSSSAKNSNHSESIRIGDNGSNNALPTTSPQSSIDCIAIRRDRLPIDECCAVFSSSTSSAFTKYKSTKHHKKPKLFRAKVEVERGYHLPKVTHPFSQSGFADNPNTFVKLQTSCHSLDERLFSNVVQNSCDPVWMACFDVDLPTQLLKQGVSERLVVQVFEKRERVTQLLGSTAIGLGVLGAAAVPSITGWFNLFDVSGVCKGQIRVNITPIDNIANLRFDSPDTSEKETCGTKNIDHNIGETSQKQSGNLLFSNVEMSEVDGAEELSRKNKIENPSDQITSSLKSKLSELDLLIDALKTKLKKSGRSHPIEETVGRFQASKSSSSIEDLEKNDSLKNFYKIQRCGVPKILTGSSCSNDDRDFDDDRKTGLEDVGRKCSDQQEDPSDDNRQDDDSQFRTYSVHSYDDDSSTKTDLPDNSDQE
ncbi:hypothetical protein LSTR_LSTR009579 [Laodelphax striatellus]|uniref:C2 domain-containing protein n=1 Tax=Laodelphax striatellus TaxID=195883 RepID=A0A482WRA1_LAOST|nr:hypothetical protein LSTR_LSTR009579 [Laodelphax striatellus]